MGERTVRSTRARKDDDDAEPNFFALKSQVHHAIGKLPCEVSPGHGLEQVPLAASWKSVAHQLVNWAKADASAKVYVAALMQETGLSRGTVQRCITVLEHLGVIAPREQSPHRDANRYRVLLRGWDFDAGEPVFVSDTAAAATGDADVVRSGGTLPGGVDMSALIELVQSGFQQVARVQEQQGADLQRQAAAIDSLQRQIAELHQRGGAELPQQLGVGADRETGREADARPEQPHAGPASAREPESSKRLRSAGPNRRRTSSPEGHSTSGSAGTTPAGAVVPLSHWRDLVPEPGDHHRPDELDGLAERLYAAALWHHHKIKPDRHVRTFGHELARRYGTARFDYSDFADDIWRLAASEQICVLGAAEWLTETFFARVGFSKEDPRLQRDMHPMHYYPQHAGNVLTDARSSLRKELERVAKAAAKVQNAEPGKQANVGLLSALRADVERNQRARRSALAAKYLELAGELEQREQRAA